ncbi:type III-A CRISPR-associated RAMP protein Csm5 [Thermohalobacter berrensis]|uniref:CRISPR system Cms protein Csm5 n=1 Tax=Thermohalobacter berrensis TaxID=99594 RepID=A0A419T1F8_9FIRM|nr:type III-A CRISPR-associated RAMP protein Csm5 [Thermohalobacter berrensis]RKD31286.1 type III-A CRISPR-associated RAMP protein Csm5 [Thermohalobacter berrensis]
MEYRIEVLSPIHIGSSKSYRPIDYIEKEEEVLIFDEKDVLSNIKESHMLNSQLLRGIGYTGKRAEYYKNLDHFIHKGIIDNSILDKVKVRAIKKIDDLKAKEIKGTMRNIQGTYIPGGTLKGIVRTAVFYHYVKNKGIDFIKKGIEEIKRNRKVKDIEDCIIGKFKKNILKDPFRFLRIRDVNIKGDVAVYQENIFNIKSYFLSDIIEVMCEGSYSEKFKFKTTLKKEIANKLDLDNELTSYLNEKNILKALYEYSKDIIEDEINYFSKNKAKLFNNSEILKELEKYKDLNKQESPIIRIGKSTGFKSHTLGLAVKQLDKDFYNREFIKFIRPPKYDKRYEFPKTRKFVGLSIAPKLLGFAIVKKAD